MQASEFELPDQTGKTHKLSDYRGKWVVLYFYPKDDTPGCTKEARGFRENLKAIGELGAAVMGVSKDSVESHRKFAEKYQINFPILSDPEKTVIKAYGAWGAKKFMGKEYDGTLRKTVLINPNGEIVKTYEQVNPIGHAEEVLKDLAGYLVS